jgi:RHS repeat-associated protein
MATVVSPQNKTTTYHYDAVGNRDSVVSPNGGTSGYQYDNLNRLTRVRHYKAGTILAHYAYALNAAGIRMQVTEKDSSKVFYGYDSLYRLKSERRTGNHTDTMTYTYDPVGNRLTKAHRGVTTTYAYNNRDQLLSEWDGTDSTRYSYDSSGRMLTKAETGGTTHYLWRDEDRLDSLYGPGVSMKYQYDSEGRRVKDSTGSTVRQYLFDPLLPYGQIIAETDGSNNLTAEYVYGTDRVSLQRSGAAHYYLADGQGSTRLLTDSTGTATDSTVYTAFGETLFSSGSTANDFKYVGEQLDPNSGFYYNRARWMDPSTGRMIGVDPFEGDPQAPVSLHRYLYANASPLNFSDPSGEMAWSLTNIQTAFVISAILTATHVTLMQSSPVYRMRWNALWIGLASSINNAADNLELMVITDQIAMAENNKHWHSIINSQFEHALIHANKLASSPPGDENGWKEEVEAALGKVKRVLKRITGKKTKAEIEAKIKEIAEKARVNLRDIPE